MLDGRMTFPIKGLKTVMLEINVYPDNAVIIVQYGRMAENIVTMLFDIDTACVLHKDLGDAILVLSNKETKQ